MMCGFTVLGAFLLSVAYKGGSSPVAGIVLLSIGGACNLWACFWRSAIGEDGDDRFCTDDDCAPIGCHYVPVFLMIGGAALGLSDGDVGLMVWGVICLFAGLVLILRWRARIFCSAVERQASERRQLEEREERARAAVPGAVSFDEMMQTIRRELVLPEEMPTSSALSSACDQLGLPSDGTLEQKAARCYEDISPVRAAAAAPASAAAPRAAKGSSR